MTLATNSQLKKYISILVITNLGYLAVCFCKIFLLGLLQEFGPSCDGENDAVRHPVVMETEVHSSLEVSGQQSLRDQAVYILQGNKKV